MEERRHERRLDMTGRRKRRTVKEKGRERSKGTGSGKKYSRSKPIPDGSGFRFGVRDLGVRELGVTG